ncbi:uncharacterized protein EV422DRAFT_581115 [Fimicolochytrium jonesii]|uniref:uncharacterized protein n=1 Tax=Fimicolochytrium jonesii TaxID=1396493 RepID=UPI0022FE00E2|nr:uncharacterized protein EV422DRAFT_581115 [Fimicolochytrium jonesii]KAI8816986.1 hypothetical protein EV422DRAFT_581115 [Fimicolochytrium jonesii]
MPPPHQTADVTFWLNELRGLLASGEWKNLERPVEILRHVDGGHPDHARAIAAGETPNISYVADPFQSPDFHAFFSAVDPARLSWDSIHRYLEGDHGAFRASDDKSVQVPEHVLLVLVYLAVYGTQTRDATREEPEGLRRLRTFVQSKTLKLVSASPQFWSSAFSERNLRLYSIVEGGGSASNVQLNEVLEAIRLRHVFTLPVLGAAEAVPQPADLDIARLGAILSCSLFSVVEFAGRSEFVTMENINLLARFQHYLPKSWFVADFLDALLKEALRLEVSVDPEAITRLTAIMSLLAVWMRKSDVAENTTLQFTTTELAARLGLRSLSVSQKRDLLLQSLHTLCHAFGKVDLDRDVVAMEAICQGLSAFWQFSASQQDGLYIALVQLLKASPPTSLGAVVRALLSAAAPAPDSGTFFNVIKAMQFFQHVTGSFCEDVSSAKPATRTWRSFLLRTPAEPSEPALCLFQLFECVKQAHADATDIWGKTVALAALAGLTRGLEDSLGNGENVAKDVLELSARARSALLSAVLDTPGSLNNLEEPRLLECCQQVITYTSADTLDIWQPNLTAHLLNTSGSPLLTTLLDTVFIHPQGLSIDHSLVAEAYSTPHHETPPPIIAQLTTKTTKETQHPITASLGRISRVIGTLCGAMWVSGQLEGVYDAVRRMEGFAGEMYAEWEAVGVKEMPEDRELWVYLKSVLFVVSVVGWRVTERMFDAPSLRVAASEDEGVDYQLEIVKQLLRTFAHLHFVTARFGLGGFATWEETVDGLLQWVEDREGGDARRGRSMRDKSVFEEILEELQPTYRGIYVHPNTILKTRLLFTLTLALRHFHALSAPYISTHLLPRLYPYLFYNYPTTTAKPTLEDQDLFETSHALCAQLFANAGRRGMRGLVCAFAEWYVKGMVSSFPETVDWDLCRRGVAGVLRGLAGVGTGPAGSGDRRGGEEEEDGEGRPRRVVPGRGGMDAGSGLEVDEEASARRKDRVANALHAHDEEQQYDGYEDGYDGKTTLAVQEEADRIAWTCIGILLERISRLSHESEADVSKKQRSATTSFTAPRLHDILTASPHTARIMHRDQLAMVLFDQINTVALTGLEPLLATIRYLLLGSAGSQTDVAWLWLSPLLHPSDHDHATHADDDDGIDHKPPPLLAAPTRHNPDTSPLYKHLFDAVAAPNRGFDYARRERCVRWYLEVLEGARRVWREAGHGGGAVKSEVESESLQLRAKL